MSHEPQQSGFSSAPARDVPDEEIYRLERPVPELLTYYTISSLLTVIFFPIVFPSLFFKYRTMKYRFDDEGVSMSWGLLFRREINLTYARIQDIHLSSNFIERRLGLAKVQLQTASGSASAEMTIEGLRQYEAIRNFLYERVKGERRLQQGLGPAVAGAAGPVVPEGAVVLEPQAAEKIARAMEAVAARLEELEARLPRDAAPPPAGPADHAAERRDEP